MKAVFNRVSLMLALTAVLAGLAVAAPQGGGQRRGGKGGANMGVMRLVNQLNLTDEQKTKVMAIAAKYAESTKTQREEMMKLQRDKKQGTASADADDKLKALRKELNQANKAMRDEITPILTAEQRTQLETLMKEDQAKQKAARANGSQ